MMLALFLSAAFLFGAESTVDIIGYYGNSGNAVNAIPKIIDIHSNYNIVILTFASIDSSGSVSLDIQGPYDKDLKTLGADIKKWKSVSDKWGRRKLALVSIGGQNGQWPSGLSPSTVEAGLDSFMNLLNLDGLDIDLEGGSVSAATSLVPVVASFVSKGKVMTAAPEASQTPLNAYKKLLPHLSWVHPQFYNNGPNGVAAPYVPDATLWPTPWTVTDWQAESGGESFWAGVLAAIAKADGLTQAQQGMLVPATASAAGSYNHWDIEKLASQVKSARVSHVGTWAIAYDHAQGWKLAEALGSLNDQNFADRHQLIV